MDTNRLMNNLKTIGSCQTKSGNEAPPKKKGFLYEYRRVDFQRLGLRGIMNVSICKRS